MNTQRVTVSMPQVVYQDLVAMFGRGQVSQFVAEATEEKLLEKKVSAKIDPVKNFLQLRKDSPKFSDKKIFEAISLGRI